MSLFKSLVSKYDLDSDGNDSVGSANATLTNVGFSTVAGRDSAYFNTSAEIVFPGTSVFEGGTATLSLWIRTSDHDAMIYQARDSNGGHSYLFFRIQNGKLKLQIQNSNGSYAEVASDNMLPENDWTHVLLKMHSTGSCGIYVNGALDATSGNVQHATAGNATFIFDECRMGAFAQSGAAGSATFLGGSIDDVRFWDRSLELDEVADLYAGRNTIYNHTLESVYESGLTSLDDNNGVTFDGVANFSAVANVGTNSLTIPEGSGITAGVVAASNLSISLWIKAHITDAPTTNQDVILFTNDQVQPAMRAMTMRLSVDEHGNVKLKLRRNGSTKTLGTFGGPLAAVDGSAWTHIFFTLDDANDSMTLYIDNNLSATTTGWGGGDNWSFDNALILGNSNDSGTAFNGKMARLKIWDEATSATLVQQYYGEGLAILNAYEANQSAELIAHYTFSDLSNTTGNADYDLVAYNGASVSDGTLLLPNANSGVYPTNEIVADPNGGDQFTVSIWFKDLADRSERDDWIQFLADHHVAPAGPNNTGTTGNYLAAIFTNDELGVFDEVNQTWESTGFQMTSANFTGWHHLVLLHDNGTTTFYVDGVSVGVPVTFDPTGVIQVFGSFGGAGGGAGVFNNAPAAALDNIRVYSGLLTASEISDLYTQETPSTSKIFTSLIGRPAPVTKPNPHYGWVALNHKGQTFESTDGAAGTWSAPSGVPGFGTGLEQAAIVRQAGFWFVIVPGDSNIYMGSNHIAYAKAMDSNSTNVFPSSNGWVQMSDDGTSVDRPRALYSDGIYAYMTVVNDTGTAGHSQNRLWRSNIAVNPDSTPVWLQLNSGASWNGQGVTESVEDTDGNSVSLTVGIQHGAAHGTLHVWVAEPNGSSFGCTEILTYDTTAGVDVITSVQSNTPNSAAFMGCPVYCSASYSWFVPCRDGVVKSTDQGLNWSQISISYGSADYVYMKAVAASANGTLVAVGYTTTSGVEEGIIFRSDDDGATWTAVATHEENLYSVAAATDDNWMVGGTNNTLGYSMDDGESWANASDAEDNGTAGATISAVHYGGLEQEL